MIPDIFSVLMITSVGIMVVVGIFAWLKAMVEQWREKEYGFFLFFFSVLLFFIGFVGATLTWDK